MTTRKVAEVFPPGDFIKEELEARNWSQAELAEIIGRHPRVINEIIMGKRSIAPEIAKALADAFGTSAQYWMNLESAYQLWRAKDVDNEVARRAKLYELAPIKEMIKRHWLEQSENIDVLEKQVEQFFGINSLDDPIHLPQAARKSTQELTVAQRAWIFRARHLARAATAKPFSANSFKQGLSQLKQLLRSAQEVRNVSRILAEAGIRFLILEHLPQTKIDGVTFWLDDKSPVVVLSLRFDRIDWFWYTLSHELGHVEHRDGLIHTGMLDTDLVGDESHRLEPKPAAEQHADSFAAEFLIEQAELDNFIQRVHPLYGRQKILGFANRVGVHPGIVVGQLQFRKEISWSSYRPMLEKVKHIVIQSALTDGWGEGSPLYKSKEA